MSSGNVSLSSDLLLSSLLCFTSRSVIWGCFLLQLRALLLRRLCLLHRPMCFLGLYNINVDVAFMTTPVWLINLCRHEGKDDEVTFDATYK